MQLKLILPAMAIVVALGVSIGAMLGDSTIQSMSEEPDSGKGKAIDAMSGDGTIQREEIKDFSYFSMPTLPSAKVVDSIVSAESVQNSEYATDLAHGYRLIAVKQDLFYGETSLFYATPEIRRTITNDDSIQDLVGKGVIVFYYEQSTGLESRTSSHAPISMTSNSNPVYTNSGLHGEYLTIAHPDENILLYVYGNDSIDLRELIKPLDL